MQYQHSQILFFLRCNTRLLANSSRYKQPKTDYVYYTVGQVQVFARTNGPAFHRG